MGLRLALSNKPRAKKQSFYLVLSPLRLRSVSARPTQNKGKTMKNPSPMKKCRSYFDDIKVSRVFPCFFLAAFEAGGHRPQPHGLKASASRKGRRLAFKTGGVPLGFKRSKMFFMVFIIIRAFCKTPLLAAKEE